MEKLFKRSLLVMPAIMLAVALPELSYADKPYTTEEKSDSAHANFYLHESDMPRDIMVEFGYFRSNPKGKPIPIPMPVPEPGLPMDDMDNIPFIPAPSEYAYLVIHIMTLFPPPIPVPMPDPSPEPIPVDPPLNTNMDNLNSDGGVVVMPTEPSFPPYEVYYFEVNPDQITITEDSTHVEVDSCTQNPMPFMPGECGVITVSWQNNNLFNRKENIKSEQTSMEPYFGQVMKMKSKIRSSYSSADVTASFLNHNFENSNGGRSSSFTKQKTSFGN